MGWLKAGWFAYREWTSHHVGARLFPKWAARRQRKKQAEITSELIALEDDNMKWLDKFRTSTKSGVAGVISFAVLAAIAHFAPDFPTAGLEEWITAAVMYFVARWSKTPPTPGVLCPPAVVALAVLIALALLTSQVRAAEKTIHWTPPTEYTNGAPLDSLEELERYELGCGDEVGARDGEVRSWIATPSATRVEDFGIGAWFCALRVRSITTAEQQGDWSDWSNEVAFTIAPPTLTPVAPTNLGIS